jgi:dipeptidyl aminopeptidase/acylaminoacyl peptidase
MKKLLIIILSGILLFGCSNSQKESIIEKPANVDVVDGKLTPEILWSFGRLGEIAVSPDNATIAYTVSYYDIEKNKGNAEIYLCNADGSDIKRLTISPKSESNLVWLDANTLLFGYEGNIYQQKINEKKSVKLGDLDGVEGFSLSPDKKHILFAKSVPVEKPEQHLFTGLDKTSGRVIEDLGYRHWDGWVDNIPHLFVADFDGKNFTNAIDILEGQPFEAPTLPFGGMEETDWAPDSKSLAYTCKPKVGKEYAFSTNTDIYIYHLEEGVTENVSSDIEGYDRNPRFSPTGNFLAWESMERDGYESDLVNAKFIDLRDNAQDVIVKTMPFEGDAINLIWADDENSITFLCPWHARTDVYSWNIDNDKVSRITNGPHEFTSLHKIGDKFVGAQMSSMYPAEIILVSNDGSEKNISNINTDLLSKLKFGKAEEKWIKTTDNKEMLVTLYYPANFDSTKKYPALLFCEGGPQSMTGYFWSYRWNFQMMASGDYFVVAPNRRGTSGFGKEWCEAISGDYGGQCMKDYFSAIDYFAEHPNIDKTKLGCCGASFGGFSVYWIAGHHNNRFKALLAHDGMFNLEQQYLETEEMWFVNFDLGGPFWDKSDKKIQKSLSASPHLFVDKWNTPICVIHSELDYRITASQGMAAFNAAQIKGIPSRYLYFPDENHWVLKPQNSLLWHRNFLDWFDKYLK